MQFKEESVGRDHGGSSLRPYDTKLEADNQWRDSCGSRRLLPMVKSLSIWEPVRFLDEALESGIDLCGHVSYRGAAREVERIGGRRMSYTTIHIDLTALKEHGRPATHSPPLLDNPNKTNKIKKVTPEQLDKVLAAFEKVGKQVGMI